MPAFHVRCRSVVIMSEAPVVRKAIPQAQSTASGHTQMTSRPLHVTEPTASKHVCFYKSGDSQFSGLPVVINSRTFKTFEALLDSLSKRVPLPFGVRTITTPRGHTAVQSLDQLHHGHSYICSDRRTVKPIDLERARRKLPPWYHARPVSARCLAWYTHNSAQHGICSARRNEHAILLHTTKRLVLFRNGEPEVKHTLMLQRRTTYSFEALLDRMSEVMHFPVLRLHTPDGRRVDGLPALILCSGVLVAAGREPFKKRNYDVQKSSPPTWLPVKRLGRRHPIARKKKSSSTKSRPFSPSSEHYFVNQIQNCMSGSMYDFPSNPNGSVEVEPGQQSVAETEVITCRNGEKEDDIHMPSDDDIEKAFRVNQDGSMTVEMKVRLTIKEEETIHWTTTVSRSSLYNQFKAATISCPDLDANLPDNLPPQSDTLTIEVSESDPNDSNHFYREDGCKVNEETEISGGAASMELERLPSPLSHFPGLQTVQHKQESIESIKTVSDTEFHMNHSYSDTEELDSGDVKQEYCMDGLSHLNAYGQADANLSCSEAMHMMQSLKELAAIEDAEHLRISLSHLHNSASVQLLQSWKGFQVLINKAMCSGATPEIIVSKSNQSSSSEEEEHAIQVLMEYLGVPERVREELASLNHLDESICNQIEDTDKISDSFPAMKMNGFSELHSKEKMDSSSDFVLEDCVNMYVNSVIDRAITAHLKDSDNSQVFVIGSLERPEKDLVIEDRYQQDLRNDNFCKTKKEIKGDAIPVSDICKDMPPGESSFEAEMYRELEKVGETFKKHQEKVEEMSRVERQKEITEGRGTCKENRSKWDNSESLKTVFNKEELIRKVVNEIQKDRDTVEEEGSKLSLVSCIGKLNLSAKEKVNQQEENGRYSDETFPKDKYFSKENNLNVKSPDINDGAEQICLNETISGHWQNEFQAIQTQDQLHNKTKRTERDIVLPEVQGISHTRIESNIEVDEKQHSTTHQDFCMKRRTYSEEEHVILEAPECYTIYQENCVEIPEEIIEYEENENNFEEARASTVAKPFGSLQDQEKSVGKIPYNTEQTTGKRLTSHSVTNQEASKIIKTTESGSMDSVSSSLAFSYDSKNSDLAKDSEAHIQTNRVKSIRDMFHAKSNTDMQHGQAQLSSPSSELSNYQLESSHRKEYQSLTSSEVSREEKNTCRLSIAKGYVKRTIEQLYGKGSKGCSSDEKRSPSTENVDKREGLRYTNASSLPSLHEVHTNAIPDLSYFNATSSVDRLNEPMNCVTLNVRVGPKDAVLIDKGRWLLRENQMSLKSCLENEDTSKNIEDKDVLAESEQDSGKEDIPYSLFDYSSMMPDKDPSFTEQEEECPGRTITYFHLPNANDSEIQADDQKTATPKKKTENKVTPLTEPPKCWAEKHSIVTVFTPMDIKKAANKVHPMIETTPPVITQPTKGQSAEVARHSVEPDALEILYMFCGQHCPIL
ncbi:hypothetical protein G5714_007744 [Onychostoma macrolepis]|uniref:Doublecortin domain-containing protein n=1 Tax=Onychostoma macrolepis TaxID=369639 RepID=A0A7J6CVY4_9TELE|nr:hypothetical protein G5714_007744 [Onychostoma macrolepis]